MKKWLKIIIGVGLVLFLLIQLIPYGRAHSNPAVVQEPTWDSPQTRELAMRACADCHSNETVWPWYSNIAPVSWVVTQHVNEGRSKFNFSEMNRSQRNADEAAGIVKKGEMPPGYFKLMHKSARLSDEELSALITGLQATFGGDINGGEEGDD